MASRAPRAPAQPVAQLKPRDVIDALPPNVRKLYRQRWCTPIQACHLLGLSTKTGRNGAEQPGGAFYARAEAYRQRIAEVRRRPHDLAELYPLADGKGGWLEIPNSKAGAIRVDTTLLVPMLYPQVNFPW